MRAALRRLTLILPAALLAGAVAPAAGPTGSALVHKASADIYSGPDLASPKVATLKRDDKVNVAGQQGLWFKVETAQGAPGFVRVNDVRMQMAKAAAGGNSKALFKGKAGKGRVSETASVRGLDESDLKAASFDAVQFAKLESYRVEPKAAASEASTKGLKARKVAYATEFKPDPKKAKKGGATQQQKRGGLAIARGLLGAIGGTSAGDSALGVASAATGKSEAEQAEEELALGPEIAGRVLGAAKLWNDEPAQQRVNRIGRWVASQTSRPDLPWAFGVIDTPELNAFAAPGGYILVTRGLYTLLEGDEEVAAVLSHEISHAVQRDHYNVIHKQETSAALKDVAAAQVNTGGSIAGNMAKNYVAKHGATVMLTGLDREAEYRSDEAAEIYLARAGYDPLALYSVLQKMAALGTASGGLEQLYKTHPPFNERLDRLDGRSAKVAGYTQRK